VLSAGCRDPASLAVFNAVQPGGPLWGRTLCLGDRHELRRVGLDDLVVVSPDSPAMLSKYAELASVRLRHSGEVPPVGVLGNDPQRQPFSPAADENRRKRIGERPTDSLGDASYYETSGNALPESTSCEPSLGTPR
jgi:hypothetical protein